MSALGPFLPRRPFAFVSVMKGKAAAPLAKPRGSWWPVASVSATQRSGR